MGSEHNEINLEHYCKNYIYKVKYFEIKYIHFYITHEANKSYFFNEKNKNTVYQNL